MPLLLSIVSQTNPNLPKPNMSSTKAYLCDLCLILLLTVCPTFVIAEEKPNSTVADEGPKGNCSCGGFSSPSPASDAAPLLSQSPGLVIKCDEEGYKTCKNLCTALATATKAKGPEILCSRLKTATELKLSAFYKACNASWVYANMTADTPLCCVDSKVKVCASVEQARSTQMPATNTTLKSKTVL